MADVCIDGASVEAYGHPTNCTEPAPGSLISSEIVEVNGTPIVTEAGTVDIPTHAHDYDSTNLCHQDSSHSFAPSTSHIFTVNGNDVVLNGDIVGSDPVTGGDVDVADDGGNDILGVS